MSPAAAAKGKAPGRPGGGGNDIELGHNKKPMTLKQLGVYAMMGVVMIIAAACIYYGAYQYMANNRKAMTLDAIDAIEEGNLARAGLLLSKASEAGDPLAAELLVWFEGRRGNYEKAYQLAIRAVALGSVRQNEILGLMSLRGLGINPGAEQAYKYFEKAVTSPEIPLERRDAFLKRMVDSAVPYVQSQADHTQLTIKGVALKAKGSLLTMGDILFLGDGMDRNPVKAIEYWQEAAKAGVVEANTRLAGVNFHGYGTPRNPRQALEYYQTAIKGHDPVAMYDFALIALRHKAENLPVSRKLFEEAAKRGFGPAMSVLGILAMVDGARDEAYSWFEKSYSMHDICGSLFYALMSYNGDACPKDEEKGLAVLVQEKDVGSEIASNLLRALARSLNGKEIFGELVGVARRVIYGELSYFQGAPEAQYYNTGSLTAERFYRANQGDPEEAYAVVGSHNYPEINLTHELNLSTGVLEVPGLSTMILHANPTTGASLFVPLPVPPKPEPPTIPREYRSERRMALPGDF